MPSVNLFLSLPSDLHAELYEFARQRGISLSDIVIESLLDNAEAHRRRGCKVEPTPIKVEFKQVLRCA